MKLLRLLLHAFGPFTDAEIDFTGGGGEPGSGLHLIYGQNEAGKSSALRAMTDLRFGIPTRSSDNFIHPFKDLRIGGVFVGRDGKPVGLVRRKGTKSTLALFDPLTADLDDTEEAGAEHERELTGGLQRDEFEAMFGLNHGRLREGGDQLVKGEGELGSALFEASAGTRGIEAILQALDDEAKTLYRPTSRGSAVVNEARRSLDQHRKAWKEAQTRPAEWQELNRAHEQSAAALGEIDRRLELARRQHNELTELRTVAPLIHAHDLTTEELEALEDAPDLLENARDLRLAAEGALQRAETDLQMAVGQLNESDQAMNLLVIEAPLLAHGEAIERLANRIEAVTTARINVQQHQAAIDQIAEELSAAVARFAPGEEIQALLAAMPSDADRAMLDEHLTVIPRLRERLESYQNRMEALSEADRADADDAIVLPDADVRQQLAVALKQGHDLGNTVQRKNDQKRTLDDVAAQLKQRLWDLGVESIEGLRRSRTLLASQIDNIREELAGIDDAARRLREEAARLDGDLQEQKGKERQFAAVGEIVTAETLRLARAHRDQGWALIRKAYIEQSGDPEALASRFDAEQSLPDAFEQAQETADRQADLLRADAERAARYAECLSRIGQMERRQREIEEALTESGEGRKVLLDGWFRQLADAGLPRLEPNALREWQDAREAVLESARHFANLETERDQLVVRETEAVTRLGVALQAVGQVVSGSDLARLIEQAAQWERRATESVVKEQERTRARVGRRTERERLARQREAAEQELQGHLAGVGRWKSRLYLGADSTPAAVKARLDELDRLARRHAAQQHEVLQRTEDQAVVDDFEKQTVQLARLVGEDVPEASADFIERLHTRFNASREHEQRRLSLLLDKQRAETNKRNAEAEIARQTEVLHRLCVAAGVQAVADLPACEARAGRRRQLKATLEQQRRQLGQATRRPEAELRERLADQDAAALEAERERCAAEVEELEEEQRKARGDEEHTRRALEAIDASDAAARAREAMESAVARCQGAIRPWARLKLAHALLRDALKRYRERAQGPMVTAASAYFSLMTDTRYRRLVADETADRPVLLAERHDGVCIGPDAMSEGTADQLYLALRLAALELRRRSHPDMPLILDDVLITSDDTRAANILKALARFAEGSQVLLFTHHRHLIDLAGDALNPHDFAVHRL